MKYIGLTVLIETEPFNSGCKCNGPKLGNLLPTNYLFSIGRMLSNTTSISLSLPSFSISLLPSSSISPLLPLSRFIFNKGCRVAIRSKVNELTHTGLRVVETILTLGKGQRQLIIGDRVSGKTSILLVSFLTQSTSNALFGNKRCFCV